jgi:radical SAM protein with 4Fe4S-binding SPASM domain
VEEQTVLNEDPARVQRWFDHARAAAKVLAVELRLPCTAPRPRSSARRCDGPWRGAYVSFSGEAMPCCMVATPDRANLGSMAGQGVVAIWNGEAYRDFRERLDSDHPPEVCRGCAVYQGTF